MNVKTPIEKQIDIFLLWVWFVTDHNLYEFENHEQLVLLQWYSQNRHWMDVSNTRYIWYLRKDLVDIKR